MASSPRLTRGLGFQLVLVQHREILAVTGHLATAETRALQCCFGLAVIGEPLRLSGCSIERRRFLQCRQEQDQKQQGYEPTCRGDKKEQQQLGRLPCQRRHRQMGRIDIDLHGRLRRWVLGRRHRGSRSVVWHGGVGPSSHQPPQERVRRFSCWCSL